VNFVISSFFLTIIITIHNFTIINFAKYISTKFEKGFNEYHKMIIGTLIC
jgi:hypothetical protein